MDGDRLTVVSKRGTFVAIPTSATEFLAFEPDDLAQYTRHTFASDATKIKVSYPEGEVLAEWTRVGGLDGPAASANRPVFSSA